MYVYIYMGSERPRGLKPRLSRFRGAASCAGETVKLCPAEHAGIFFGVRHGALRIGSRKNSRKETWLQKLCS